MWFLKNFLFFYSLFLTIFLNVNGQGQEDPQPPRNKLWLLSMDNLPMDQLVEDGAFKIEITNDEFTGEEVNYVWAFQSGNFSDLTVEVELNITNFNLEEDCGDFLIISPYLIPKEFLEDPSTIITPEDISKFNFRDSDLLSGTKDDGNGKNNTYQLFGQGFFVYLHIEKAIYDDFVNGNGFNDDEEDDTENDSENEILTNNSSFSSKNKNTAKNKRQALNPDDYFEDEKLGFTLFVYDLYNTERQEEEEATTEPTIPANVTNFLLEYLYVPSVTRFVHQLEDFKSIIVLCTEAYLDSLPTRPEIWEEITNKSIWVNAYFCEKSWPEYEHCVRVNISILAVDKHTDKYIMTEDHLGAMWNYYVSYYKDETIKEPPFFPLDREPSKGADRNETKYYVWAALAVCGAALFLICLLWTRVGPDENPYTKQSSDEYIEDQGWTPDGHEFPTSHSLTSSANSGGVKNHRILGGVIQKMVNQRNKSAMFDHDLMGQEDEVGQVNVKDNHMFHMGYAEDEDERGSRSRSSGSGSDEEHFGRDNPAFVKESGAGG